MENDSTKGADAREIICNVFHLSHTLNGLDIFVVHSKILSEDTKQVRKLTVQSLLESDSFPEQAATSLSPQSQGLEHCWIVVYDPIASLPLVIQDLP